MLREEWRTTLDRVTESSETIRLAEHKAEQEKRIAAQGAFERNRETKEDTTIYINGIPSTEVTSYQRVGREYFSLGGDFKYTIVCKPDTDACGGRLIEVQTGREIPVTIEDPVFFEEKYLFGLGGGAMGADTGLYLVSLEEFDKEVEYIELLREHNNYSNAFKVSDVGDENGYLSEINLLSDKITFKKTYKQKGGERTLLTEYFVEIKNPRSNVEVLETIDFLE